MKSRHARTLAALALFATAAGAEPSGPFATTAKVEVQGDKGNMPLNKSGQVAFMFLSAITQEEQNCSISTNAPCTLDQVIAGRQFSGGQGIKGLKFDPRTTDPDYTFTLTIDGSYWSLAIAPKKPGLVGLYREANFVGTIHYNLNGAATAQDPPLMGDSIVGDTFVRQP